MGYQAHAALYMLNTSPLLPADMSKVSKERPMSAQCIDYLDDSSKRIKKGFGGFPQDGAGG